MVSGSDDEVFLEELVIETYLKGSTTVNTLPGPLIDQVREGRVVLFLGAGALKGAVHPKGLSVPEGKQLATAICDEFLSGNLKDRPLAQVAELAISERSLSEVQDFIASFFRDFGPADFHKLIPTFVWMAIATTNYDLVIEKAYSRVLHRTQDLSVFRKNGERIEDNLVGRPIFFTERCELPLPVINKIKGMGEFKVLLHQWGR